MELTILGPERPDGILPEVLRRHGIRGPVALISAGWRYDEARDEPLRAAVDCTVHNLGLYQAFRELERDAPDLVAAWTRKQEILRKTKALYRIRITHAEAACQALWAEREDPECRWFNLAVRALREADEHFLAEARRLHAAFDEELAPRRHRLVRGTEARLEDTLAGCEALLVAGGHVGVLRNRMSFFGIDRWLRKMKIYAWSGGAMLMCRQVLLYHDHTAYGPGIAEMLDDGFALLGDTMLLPHARERLKLDQRGNMAILARRLAPARVLGLQNGACYEAGRFTGRAGSALHIRLDGSVHAEGA